MSAKKMIVRRKEPATSARVSALELKAKMDAVLAEISAALEGAK